MMAKISQYRFVIFASILFLLLRLPSIFEPYWYGDEGVYLTLGEAIRHGDTLYSQIHDNKPPTLYYLAALGKTVFGFRLLLLVWMIPTVIAFYYLATKFVSRRLSEIATFIFIVLTSIPLIEGNIANSEIFMLLPTIVGVLIYFLHPGKTLYVLLSGLLLGFAFTLKVPVAAEVFFLAFWTIFFVPKNKIKSSFLLGISFILPISLWALYFGYNRAISQFLFAALLQNFGYLSSWSTGTHSGGATSSGVITRFGIMLIYFVFIFISKLRRLVSKNESFVLLWLGATLFGTLLSSRPYPHYLIQILPPLIISIFFLFQKNVSKFTRPFVIVAIMFVFFVIFKFKFYFYSTVPYYANFYAYALGQKGQKDYRAYFGNQVETTYSLSKYIQTKTNSDDTIFIWGDEPYVYSLSNRLPATKFVVAYHVVDFNGHEYTINQIKSHLPKLIILYPMSDRAFPKLNNLVDRHYKTVAQIGNALVYQKL